MTHRHESPDFTDLPDISVLEELDPEPASTRGSVYGRELLLGLALLLLVLGWAGWSWYRSESQRSSYVAGEQAARLHDWERARDHFLAASDYRDAATRVTNIADLIAKRDRHYTSAQEYARLQQWAAVLTEVREVGNIQPGFGEIEELKAEASHHAYIDGLVGTVALRPNADPAGLYYRTPSAWLWLEGSDRHSVVQGRGETGFVVYDAPQESPAGAGDRRLILATLPVGGPGSVIAYAELGFDTGYYQSYAWSRNGVWAFRNYESFDLGSGPVMQGRDGTQAMAYQPSGSSEPEVVDVPVSQGLAREPRLLLDIDELSDRFIYAEWDATQEASGAGALVSIYLDSFTSTAAKEPVYSFRGLLRSGQFDATGRYVVLTTIAPDETASWPVQIGDVQVVAVDLRGGRPGPQTVAEIDDLRADRGDWYSALRTGSIGLGPYTGHITVAWQEGNTARIQVIDPAVALTGNLPVELVLDSNRQSSDQYLRWLAGQSAEGLLLGVQMGRDMLSSNRAATPFSDTLNIAVVRSGGNVATAILPAISDHQIFDLRARNESLVYSTYLYDLDKRQAHFEILSAPLPILSNEVGQLTTAQVFSYTRGLVDIDTSATLPEPEPSFSFGPKMLAYSNGRDLYVAAYDGKARAMLESGLTVLYDLESYREAAQLY